MAFYVGQKVEALPGNDAGDYPYDRSVPGQVYTVAAIVQAGRWEHLILEELHQPETDEWWPGEWSKYFRPIVERKTSIEIFKAMLNPSKTEVTA